MNKQISNIKIKIFILFVFFVMQLYLANENHGNVLVHLFWSAIFFMGFLIILVKYLRK